MLRWSLKIVVFFILTVLLHLGTLHPAVLEGVRALSPFLFLANLFAGTAAAFGAFSIVLGVAFLGLSLWKRRFFCRWVCPLGFLQDVLRSVRSRILTLFLKKSYDLKYRFLSYVGIVFALATFAVILVGGLTFLWLDPLIILHGAHSAHWCRLFLAAIGVSVLIFPRFWCWTLCPCGGTQEILWRSTHFFIRPRKNTHSVSSSETPAEAPSETSFNPSSEASSEPVRRSFFRTLGALCVVAVSGGTLVALSRNVIQKSLAKLGTIVRFRPPGAVSEPEFLARCTRCGACIHVCPTHLLVPIQEVKDAADLATVETPTLCFESADSEARIYCDEGCIKCMQICPTGALRPLHQEEKKTVRLARCTFDFELCRRFYQMECSICFQSCPYGAIEEVWSDATYSNIPAINPTLCTGCGKCAAFCPGEPLIRWDADSSNASENVETTGKKALKIVNLRNDEEGAE